MSGLSEKQIICEKSDYSKPESALSSRTVHMSNNTFSSKFDIHTFE